MPVQITITGETAQEALREIGGLSAGLVGAAAPVVDKVTKTTKAATKPVETKQEEPVDTEPDTKSDPKDSGDSADIPSAADVKTKATEVTKAGKREEVRALLTEFGYKALSDVAETDRAIFMERLEQL